MTPTSQGSAPVKLAGFWVRLFADILDSLLLNVAAWGIELVVLGAAYWALRFAGVAMGEFGDFFNALWVQILNAVIYVALAAPYYILGHARYGTTLGKRPFRIVVGPWEAIMQGRLSERLTVRASAIRFFAYVLSYLPLAGGFLMVAFQKEKRGLHDFFANSGSAIQPRR